MEEEIVYNVFHQMAWGTPIGTYIFLTGVSAGAFVLSSLSYVFGMKKI